MWIPSWSRVEMSGERLGRFELGDDPGEALGQGVVDLAGQALPLLDDARLPGLGHELGV